MTVRDASSVTLLAAVLLSCSRPPTVPMKFAPAGMDPSGKYTAAPEGGVTFWGNGALRLRLYMQKGPIEVTIRAGGNVVDAEAPHVVVSIDGQLLGPRPIDSSQVRDYVINARLDSPSTKLLEIAFGNSPVKSDALAGRTLYVESVLVHQGAD